MAQAIGRLIDLSSLPVTTYKFSSTNETHQGDLAVKLSPEEQAKHSPENVKKISIEPDAGNLNLLEGTPTPRIVEVGASYSAVGIFVPAIAFYMHRDVLNMAVSAQGPWKALGDYLTSDSFAKSPPKLIVWEFTERDIGWQTSQEWLDTTFKNNKTFLN